MDGEFYLLCAFVAVPFKVWCHNSDRILKTTATYEHNLPFLLFVSRS
jgi:hypothetical protein